MLFVDLLVLLTREPSDVVQTRFGFGKPVASQRTRTLLPRRHVILVAETMIVGLTQLSSSTRWKRTPAIFSGSTQIRTLSMRITGVSVILEISSNLERRQSQCQGLSCTPNDEEVKD